MDPQVTVLMSTYNGEKFLREQMDSLLAQEGVNLRLEIRDDGSKDGTIDILEEYALKDSRVIWYKGKNVGPMKSFFMLLENAPNSSFYAFCDQDDYWEKDKLLSAICQLRRLNIEKPAMYCSNLNVVDDTLNFCRLSQTSNISTENKYSALVDFYAVGCTEVFNKPAADFMKRHLSEGALMHDSWLFLLCSFFGNVIYDFTPHIKYRQHGHNMIGSKKNKWEQIKDSMIRFADKSIQPRLQSATALLKTCGNDLASEDKKKIERMVNYKISLGNRIALLFDRDIRSGRKFTDFKYRILILFGMI